MNMKMFWTTKDFAAAAQDLVSTAFSLWRAAFLADRQSKRSLVFNHGKDFLLRVIEDNAISYQQDKNMREWTFNYYTRAARNFLEDLADAWPGTVPLYKAGNRNSTERWDYCQTIFEDAVEGFSKKLAEHKRTNEEAEAKKAARADRLRKRAKVRELTLAGRK